MTRTRPPILAWASGCNEQCASTGRELVRGRPILGTPFAPGLAELFVSFVAPRFPSLARPRSSVRLPGRRAGGGVEMT
jgi:hypothetical protein